MSADTGGGCDGPKTSGMAIAALVLALLGCTSPIGLILGIIAAVQIGNNPRRLSGSGLATAAIIVGAIFSLAAFFTVPMGAAILFPVFARAREKARQEQCLNNERQLATAMQMYVEDNDGYAPPANAWSDALLPYTGNAETFACPADAASGPCGYAYNVALDAVEMPDDAKRAELAVLWDGNGGWNAAGDATSIEFRHNGGANAAFADGHVKWFLEHGGTTPWSGGQP
ncbi:MAG TPA: hypothetical protein DGT21_15825 [Armatimonadetes bacterium]|jgi:prepilin-type processing-associated H-X9-DG protein|nr:hypothetical protein [Armatimonadota bacterium]